MLTHIYYISKMEILNKTLNKEWVGKKFVYNSKYGGEVFGTIKSVVIINEYATNKSMFNLFKKNKKNVDKIIEDYAVNQEVTWSGNRPTITIISTNNTIYDLNEIYILNN